MSDEASIPVDPSIYAPPTAPGPPSDTRARHRPTSVFFAVSPLKLVVMSFATLGGYQLFWFYANWRRLKRRGNRISPFWRTTFAYFFCYALFKSIEREAILANVERKFWPGLLATGWILTTLTWRLPGAAWLVTYAAVFFLVPVQMVMNDINRARTPDHDPNTRFTAWNIAGIVVGASLLGLAALGSLQPE